jgi:hypothetical protein
MKITKELFEKSFFTIGGGYDIEPLLRFTHLSTFFINVNLFLEKSEVIEWYDKAFKYCNEIEVLEKIIIDDFDEKLYFELAENYVQHLTHPDFISQEDLHGYQNIFNQAIHLEQFAVVYKLLRKSVNRVITFYFCTAEGLASYLILSQNGKFAPHVLCTIETGVLEHPDSVLNSLFTNQTKKKPTLWIRGFEPRYSPFKIQNNALDSIGIYKNKVLDFNSKWYCGWSYYPRQKKIDRYCKGFTHDDALAEINRANLKSHFTNNKHQFKFERLGKINTKIKNIDCIVVSKKTSLNLQLFNCNLLYWEDFTSNHFWWNIKCVKDQIYSLNEILNSMQLENNTTLHIIPFCLEDEGELYYNSLSILKYNTITYLPNIFDFFDLKNAINIV